MGRVGRFGGVVIIGRGVGIRCGGADEATAPEIGVPHRKSMLFQYTLSKNVGCVDARQRCKWISLKYITRRGA